MNFFRKYLILSTSESEKVNWGLTCEKHFDSARKSISGEKVLVSWWSTNEKTYIPSPDTSTGATLPESEPTQELEGTIPPDPSFINDLSSSEGPYLVDDIVAILSSSEWTVDITK